MAIVVESKSVYSTSPETVYMRLGDRSFMATEILLLSGFLP